MAQSAAETTAELLTRDPPSDSAEASGGYDLRATGSWNRLNRALTVNMPRKLRRAEQARLRIARMR